MAEHEKHITRRAAVTGMAGLVLGFYLPPGRASAQSGAAQVFTPDGAARTLAPNAFVRIGTDDTVTVLIKHIEFGQGPMTGLATLVAEELDADWARMRAEHAPSNPDLYKNLAFGMQGTGGSTAMANSYEQMRRAGATARAMLVQAAARTWGVSVEEITVERGVLRHTRSGRNGRFGQFAEAAAKLPVPANAPLKEPARFRLIGRDGVVTRLDSPAKANGTAQFTIDIREPGMLTVVVARPPRFGGQARGLRGRRRAGRARGGGRQGDPLRRRSLCGGHVARAQGTREAARHLGRGRRREAQHRRARRGVSGAGAQAGDGGRTARRRGSGAGARGRRDRGRVRVSLPRACADGAARRLPALGREARGGAIGQPVADGRPPGDCRRARVEARASRGRDHAGRRQLRPPRAA